MQGYNSRIFKRVIAEDWMVEGSDKSPSFFSLVWQKIGDFIAWQS